MNVHPTDTIIDLARKVRGRRFRTILAEIGPVAVWPVKIVAVIGSPVGKIGPVAVAISAPPVRADLAFAVVVAILPVAVMAANLALFVVRWRDGLDR